MRGDDGWAVDQTDADVGDGIKNFIQWKGTDLCADFYCPCGEQFHIDGMFAYLVECPYCHARFELKVSVTTRPAQPDCLGPDVPCVVIGEP